MLRFTSLTPYLFVMLTLLASCSDSDNSSPAPQDTVDSLPSVAQLVTLRPLSVSEDLRIVDDLDREVLLRGVNLNSLGEYWQGDPNHQPTIAVGMQDWQEMAARGISVVRLVVNWSKLEPQRGAILTKLTRPSVTERITGSLPSSIRTKMHSRRLFLPRTPTNVPLARSPARAGTVRLNRLS